MIDRWLARLFGFDCSGLRHCWETKMDFPATNFVSNLGEFPTLGSFQLA